MLRNENAMIPEIKKKLFVPKHQAMKLEDYSVKPPGEFWCNVRKVGWEEMRTKR